MPTRRPVAEAALDLVGVAGVALALSGFAITVLNTRTVLRVRATDRRVAEPVTIVVPARDEAARIGGIVTDLCAQSGLDDARIVVVDDDSSDGTADRAREAALGNARVRVVTRVGDPPAGWTGKCAALAAGLAAAFPDTPALPDTAALPDNAAGVVVFVDADVRLAPGAVAGAVAVLRDRGLAALSPWPFQVAVGRFERLVQPLVAWSWFASLPQPWAQRGLRTSTVVACGQFLVVDRTAFDAIGGWSGVAGHPTEDLALFRAVRRAGGRTAVAVAGSLASCRMYDSGAEARAGYRRWLWSAFGSPAGAAAVALGLVLAHVVSPLVAARRRPALAAAGWGASVASRLLTRFSEADGLRRVGGAPLHAIDAGAHPLGVLVFGALTVQSLRDRANRRTVWKGRSLPDPRRRTPR